MRLDHLLSRERRAKREQSSNPRSSARRRRNQEEKPEDESQAIMAGRKAVRPINISDSFKSLYRFEGSQGIEKPQTPNAKTVRRRREAVEADPAGKERRQQMGAATGRTHLENCTGKTFREARKRGRFQSEARKCRTHKSGCILISIVLGIRMQSRQDQAKKSAGWMPRH